MITPWDGGMQVVVYDTGYTTYTAAKWRVERCCGQPDCVDRGETHRPV